MHHYRSTSSLPTTNSGRTAGRSPGIPPTSVQKARVSETKVSTNSKASNMNRTTKEKRVPTDNRVANDGKIRKEKEVVIKEKTRVCKTSSSKDNVPKGSCDRSTVAKGRKTLTESRMLKDGKTNKNTTASLVAKDTQAIPRETKAAQREIESFTKVSKNAKLSEERSVIKQREMSGQAKPNTHSSCRVAMTTTTLQREHPIRSGRGMQNVSTDDKLSLSLGVDNVRSYTRKDCGVSDSCVVIKDRDPEKVMPLPSGSKTDRPRSSRRLDHQQNKSKTETGTSIAGNANQRNAPGIKSSLTNQKGSTTKHPECHLPPIASSAAKKPVWHTLAKPYQDQRHEDKHTRGARSDHQQCVAQNQTSGGKPIGKMRSEASLSAARASGVLNPMIRQTVNSTNSKPLCPTTPESLSECESQYNELVNEKRI